MNFHELGQINANIKDLFLYESFSFLISIAELTYPLCDLLPSTISIKLYKIQMQNFSQVTTICENV